MRFSTCFPSHLLAVCAFAVVITTASAAPVVEPRAYDGQHSAIYTTTLSSYIALTVIATVTVIVPRDEPQWPTDGVRITGTIISDIGTTKLPHDGRPFTSHRVMSEPAVWTLTRNSRTQSPDPTVEAGGSVLEGTYTTVGKTSSQVSNEWVGFVSMDWRSTAHVALRETVGKGYPATITRTGTTTRVISYTAVGPSSSTFSTLFTTGFTLYTTMVRV